MKIDRVEKEGRWWHIRLTNAHVFVKRAETAGAVDAPMSDTEVLICALCEKIKELTP